MSTSKISKGPFRNRIDGNELDLSMNDLVEVPVQDLASVPKATHLDLSNNKIRILPNNFASLTHLVKIDLSSNFLFELPHSFGNLVNLYSLDLYGNQIQTLPITFCRLKRLKWLDLKNNPLEQQLKTVAGDCLDEKQCKACAKQVVEYIQNIDSELERQKQKRLQEERMKLVAEMAKEAAELEKQRQQKKAEREKRKAAALAKDLTNKLQSHSHTHTNSAAANDNDMCGSQPAENLTIRPTQGFSIILFLCSILLLILMFSCAAIAFVAFDKFHRVESMDDLVLLVQESVLEVQQNFHVWWNVFALPFVSSVNETLHDLIQSVTK